MNRRSATARVVIASVIAVIFSDELPLLFRSMLVDFKILPEFALGSSCECDSLFKAILSQRNSEGLEAA